MNMNMNMRPFGSLKPLISRLRPRFGYPNTVEQAADRQWQLSPAERACARPAVFEESDLQKITGTSPGEGLAEQVHRARGGPGQHRATFAYEIRNAMLVGGNLFSSRVSLPLSGKKRAIWASGGTRHFRSAALSSSDYGIRYFGHWLLDDLPRTLAAREIADPVSVLAAPTEQQVGYLNLLNLSAEVVTDASFDRIVVIDDVGQNAYKRARYETLRRLGTQDQAPRHAGVMLLRGLSGVRRALSNEQEVAALAKARGLIVVDPATLSADEVVRVCTGAKIVLGVEGSHLSNAFYWMAREGTVVVIQPPQRFTVVLKDTCDGIGMGYAFIVGDAISDTDFKVDLGALGRLLDRVGA